MIYILQTKFNRLTMYNCNGVKDALSRVEKYGFNLDNIIKMEVI